MPSNRFALVSPIVNSGKIINARGLTTGGVPPYGVTQAYVRSYG